MWGLDKAAYAQLLSCRRLVVGFSGGLDSTVLLHALVSDLRLSDKLHAVHINHNLSQHANAWQAHCETFCNQHAIKFTAKQISMSSASNLEACARDARRMIFKELIGSTDGLLLAHHQDDQAETLLLNLLRGTGINGLAAMPVVQSFGPGYLIRPLLNQTRAALQAYAKLHELTWINDESNEDTYFSRNYLRHEILPRLKARWPRAVQSMNQCAKHAQAATENLVDLARLDCPLLALKQATLALHQLYDLPRARLAEVLRVWLKQQGILSPETRVLGVLIEQVIFARRDALPCVQLGDVQVRKFQDRLYIVPNTPSTHVPVYPISTYRIQFRMGGERMRWRGHTRTLKYIFQTLGVPPWLRDTIPLVFIDNTLVAVLDFAIADGYKKEDIYETV